MNTQMRIQQFLDSGVYLQLSMVVVIAIILYILVHLFLKPSPNSLASYMDYDYPTNPYYKSPKYRHYRDLILGLLFWLGVLAVIVFLIFG